MTKWGNKDQVSLVPTFCTIFVLLAVRIRLGLCFRCCLQWTLHITHMHASDADRDWKIIHIQAKMNLDSLESIKIDQMQKRRKWGWHKLALSNTHSTHTHTRHSKISINDTLSSMLTIMIGRHCFSPMRQASMSARVTHSFISIWWPQKSSAKWFNAGSPSFRREEVN